MGKQSRRKAHWFIYISVILSAFFTIMHTTAGYSDIFE